LALTARSSGVVLIERTGRVFHELCGPPSCAIDASTSPFIDESYSTTSSRTIAKACVYALSASVYSRFSKKVLPWCLIATAASNRARQRAASSPPSAPSTSAPSASAASSPTSAAWRQQSCQVRACSQEASIYRSSGGVSLAVLGGGGHVRVDIRR